MHHLPCSITRDCPICLVKSQGNPRLQGNHAPPLQNHKGLPHLPCSTSRESPAASGEVQSCCVDAVICLIVFDRPQAACEAMASMCDRRALMDSARQTSLPVFSSERSAPFCCRIRHRSAHKYRYRYTSPPCDFEYLRVLPGTVSHATGTAAVQYPSSLTTAYLQIEVALHLPSPMPDTFSA